MNKEQPLQNQWTAVDNYISEKLKLSDAALEAALAANRAADLPAIDVAPNQGKLLQMFARMIGARTILEIGTLGGYSSIWLARALPANGQLVSLEFNPKHAEIARANLAQSNVAQSVEIRVGAALDLLPQVHAEMKQPFDMIFIDADKTNNAAYLEWAIKLSRPGTLIIIDNVIRDGAVIDASSSDKDVVGARKLFDKLANEPRLACTALQTVGSKGYDGFAMALVADTR
jgi:predicted O-methyltransferase YrrM